MKIYHAKNGDTLRSIAHTHHIEVSKLLSYNSHLPPNPDTDIAGKYVTIPSPNMRKKANILMCDPAPPRKIQNKWRPLTPLEQWNKQIMMLLSLVQVLEVELSFGGYVNSGRKMGRKLVFNTLLEDKEQNQLTMK
ncbi:LysM domain-containing protein [Alkalihalobacillus sp. TS-13]|uniref:LysM peptidoglycan-binding domain-containing protein n=1 Tax=Alkalihalobacillus sp. TS-13 TaxID=2842455 RepID=UPI001C86FAED|nr:LysM domain-containing protein [Alkalihalobacillus sp. TS-13]